MGKFEYSKPGYSRQGRWKADTAPNSRIHTAAATRIFRIRTPEPASNFSIAPRLRAAGTCLVIHGSRYSGFRLRRSSPRASVRLALRQRDRDIPVLHAACMIALDVQRARLALMTFERSA